MYLRGSGLTEFEVEMEFSIKPTAIHRMVKVSLIELITERVSLLEFGQATMACMSDDRGLRLKEIHDRLSGPDRVLIDMPVTRGAQKPQELPPICDEDFHEATSELAAIRKEILTSVPLVDPPITARELAIKTSTTEDFVLRCLSSPEFASWLAIPRIQYEALYQEALLRGLQRLRNEVLEAPIWEGSARDSFNLKNARIVLDTVKFLADRERKQQEFNLHLHNHAPKAIKGSSNRGQLGAASALGTDKRLPSASDIENMTLGELEALEAEIDGEKE